MTFELNTENLPIKVCPDSKAESDRKKRKLENFLKSACENKFFEIHGL